MGGAIIFYLAFSRDESLESEDGSRKTEVRSPKKKINENLRYLREPLRIIFTFHSPLSTFHYHRAHSAAG